MSVSLVGDGIFLVAIAWQAYALSNHPASLAYVGVAISLPQVLFLLVGGAASDRLPRRAVLFWADVSRALGIGALAFTVASGKVHLWELYATGALIGTATAFASPAFDAIVPQLVPSGELNQANALEQFVRPAALQLAGPALGGLAVAIIRPTGALALDAFTFAFSAFCVVRMPRVRNEPEARTARGFHRDIREGLRFVRRHVWLWGTFVSAMFTYLLFIGPTQVLLPYVMRNSLHLGASAYGLVLASGGTGALIAALLMGRARDPRRPLVWIYIWWTIATLAVAGYGLARGLAGLVVAAVIVNGAEVAGAVIWSTLKQRRVPNAMLGRVSSIDWFVSTAFLPLSYALTAPVARLLGGRTTLILAGSIGAAVTLGFLLVPGIREGGSEREAVPEERVDGAVLELRR